MAGKNKRKKSQQKEKINLVFDPKARKDFLKGFHKRKVLRREHFKETLKQMMKNERKKIREDAQGTYKNLVVSHRTVPEVQHLLVEDHDFGSHSVEIKELSAKDLAEENNWIGPNLAAYKEEKDEAESEKENEVEPDSEHVPGMDLVVKKEKVKKTEETSKPKKTAKNVELKTAKDLKRVIRKQSTRYVKKSKVYNMKVKMDRKENRKKSASVNNKLAALRKNSKKGKQRRKNKDKSIRHAARKNMNESSGFVPK